MQDSQDKYLPLLIVIGVVSIALLGGVGYAIGASEAPDKNDVASESRVAYSTSYESSRRSAQLEATSSAAARARSAGRRKGARAGTEAGRSKAQDELAAQAREQEEDSGLVTLPNGKQGYALAPEDRSLSCVGIEQGTGNCVGD